MAFASKLHLGPTFDPVRYEELEKQAQHNFEVEQKLNEMSAVLEWQKGMERMRQQRRQRRRHRKFIKFRLEVRDAMEMVATKTRSIFSRLASRRRSQEQPGAEPNTGIGEEGPYEDSVKSVTPEEIETRPPEYREERPFIEMEDVGSSDDAGEQESCHDASPRRYKHMMPDEEEMPVIEEGIVERLAQWLEPQLSGTSNHFTPENSSSPAAPTVDMKSNQSSKNTSVRPAKVKGIASPFPPFGPALHLKASGLTATSDECAGPEYAPHGVQHVAAGSPLMAGSSSAREKSNVETRFTEVPNDTRNAELKKGDGEISPIEALLLNAARAFPRPDGGQSVDEDVSPRVRQPGERMVKIPTDGDERREMLLGQQASNQDSPAVLEGRQKISEQDAVPGGAISAIEALLMNAARAFPRPEVGSVDEDVSLRVQQQNERIGLAQQHGQERCERLPDQQASDQASPGFLEGEQKISEQDAVPGGAISPIEALLMNAARAFPRPEGGSVEEDGSLRMQQQDERIARVLQNGQEGRGRKASPAATAVKRPKEVPEETLGGEPLSYWYV